MVLRILASLILLLSILFMPFWLSLFLAFGMMLYFPVFWESIILFLISDLLYGTGEARFFGFTFISFFISILLLLTIEFMKKKLKFYPQYHQ